MYKLSRYRDILTAIYNLGVATHDDPAYLSLTGQLPYIDATSGRNATRLWEIPTKETIDAAGGPPFFCVRFGTDAGYAAGGEVASADYAAKGSVTEPIWDWEVYSIHPFSEEDPDYEDAAQDMTQLFQAFNDPANGKLGGVCQSCYVAEKTPAYLELLSGAPYTAAYLKIRTAEFLYPV